MSRKKSVRDFEPTALRGRRIAVRADLNVPLDGTRITDDQRVRASVPTLELLSDAGARVVVLSHLGRPKAGPVPELSLAPVAARLTELLGRDVRFEPSVEAGAIRAASDAVPEGGVLLLENTRFHDGETRNDPDLASLWAHGADHFVHDAFGTAHRAHASTVGLATAVRARGGEAVAGLLMARELAFLRDALREPERPFVVVLGGAKISGKIDLINALLPRVDRLLIGGAMANTFLLAQGHPVGDSLVEHDRVDTAADVLERAGDALSLPVDFVVADELDAGAATRTVPSDGVRPGERIGDIGPGTLERYARELAAARTVVWNGPMGVFEKPPFAAGTLGLARAVADACDAGALTVLGGGDSAAAAAVAGVIERLSHVSTGGGASLELLSGAALPGVECLSGAEGGA